MSVRKSTRQPKKKLDSSIWDLGEEDSYPTQKRSRVRHASPPPLPASSSKKKSRVKVVPSPPSLPISASPPVIHEEDSTVIEARKKAAALTEAAMEKQIRISNGKRFNPKIAVLSMKKEDLAEVQKKDLLPEDAPIPAKVTMDLIGSGEPLEEGMTLGELIRRKKCLNHERIPRKHGANAALPSTSGNKRIVMRRDDAIIDDKHSVHRNHSHHASIPSTSGWNPLLDEDYKFKYEPSEMITTSMDEGTVKLEEPIDEKPPGRIESPRHSLDEDHTVILPMYVPDDEFKIEPMEDPAVVKEEVLDNIVKEEDIEGQNSVKEEEMDDFDDDQDDELEQLWNNGDVKDEDEDEWEDEVDEEEYEEELEDNEGTADNDEERSYVEDYDSEEYVDIPQELEKTEDDKILDKRWKETRMKIYKALGEEPPKGRPPKNEMALLKKRLLEKNKLAAAKPAAVKPKANSSKKRK